jgi:hypothetical protein
MNRKDAIHSLVNLIAYEVYEFIKANENEYKDKDRWVPAKYIKESLGLNLNAVPKDNEQQGETGWLFGIVSRILEDDKLVEYNKTGNKAFYRSKKT